MSDSVTLHIENIPFLATEQELRELFSPFGEIEEVVIPTEHGTEKTKGFAFVTFVNEEGAQKALEQMGGKEYKGRQLNINLAQDKARTRGRW